MESSFDILVKTLKNKNNNPERTNGAGSINRRHFAPGQSKVLNSADPDLTRKLKVIEAESFVMVDNLIGHQRRRNDHGGQKKHPSRRALTAAMKKLYRNIRFLSDVSVEKIESSDDKIETQRSLIRTSMVVHMLQVVLLVVVL